MKFQIIEAYKANKDELFEIINNFDSNTDYVVRADRNSIKKVRFQGFMLNVKAFKIPNIVNQIAYRFFRQSKAERSFRFGQKLLELGVLTPKPIAYFEFYNTFSFRKSYYLSEQIDYELTFRELITCPTYVNHEEILRAFTRFTFKLHQSQVEFLDHSPGNTLIKKVNGEYQFYLVDLNRMIFKPLNFEMRMRNFARLSASEDMIKIMSDEYANCYNKSYEDVLKLMSFYSKKFREKNLRKREMKKRLKFWKN